MNDPIDLTDLSTNLIDLLPEAEEPTPWLVEGWIVEGELVMIHGPSHVGKTYMVLDLALHLATGADLWHGAPLPGHARPVIYVPSEGRRGVSRRVGSWLKVNHPYLIGNGPEAFAPYITGHRTDEDGELREVWVNPTPVVPFERYDGHRECPLRLDSSEEGEKSVKLLKSFVADTSRRFGGASPVVVVDVVGDFAAGVDENSREFGHAVKLLHPESLADGNATVVVVHHEGWSRPKPGSDQRPRGHSSLDGLVDARIALDAKTNAGDDIETLTTVKVTNPKQRNEDRHDAMVLTLEKPGTVKGMQNPVITGRMDPLSERLAIDNWSTKTVRMGSERSPADDNDSVAYVRAVRAITRTLDTPGPALPKEVRAELGLAKATEADRRKRLVEKGLLAPDTSRGLGGVKLTPTGEGVAE